MSASIRLVVAKLTVSGSPISNQPALLSRTGVINKGIPLFMIATTERLMQSRLEKELARLQRNKERRIARDKQKGVHVDGADDEPVSPSSPANVPVKSAGTQRKCANCGQVGHIKTNKKYHFLMLFLSFGSSVLTGMASNSGFVPCSMVR